MKALNPMVDALLSESKSTTKIVSKLSKVTPFHSAKKKKVLSLVNVLGGNKYVCDKHSLIQQNGTYCFDQKSYFSVIAPTSTEREF